MHVLLATDGSQQSLKAARFLGWATSKGGLGHGPANATLSHLTAVEGDYAVNLDAEPLERPLDRAPRILGRAVDADDLRAVKLEPELGRDHDLLAAGELAERLARGELLDSYGGWDSNPHVLTDTGT